MYIFGGYDGQYKNDFYRFNFITNTWTAIKEKPGSIWPKARYRTSTTVYKDVLFLFGGHDGARQLNDFFCFNFTTEEWSSIEYSTGMAPSPRDSHILVNSGNSIFLFGGSTGNPRSDFYEFKIDETKWVSVNHKGG
jgi:N-acetylneuraminic acid mutarotase